MFPPLPEHLGRGRGRVGGGIGPAGGSASVVALVLWSAALALALVLCSSPVWGRAWLGDRSWVLLGLGVASVAVLVAVGCLPPRREGPVPALVAGLVAAVLAGTEARRIGQGEPVPGTTWWADMTDRVLDRGS